MFVLVSEVGPFRPIIVDSVEHLKETGIDAVAIASDAVVATLETVATSGGRVDAVVLEGTWRDAVPVALSIRGLDERFVFRGAVRARTVPIVVTGRPRLDEPHGGTRAWSESDLPDIALTPWLRIEGQRDELAQAITDVVREWRNSLVEELDYVGFTVTERIDGQIEVAHALQRRRREGEILAPAGTPGSLRANQYLILAEDLLQGFEIYAEFKYLIQHYDAIAHAEGIKAENVFQRFFEAHPHLLKRNLFEHVWAKPKLRRPEAPGRHYAPDFVLKPTVGAHVGTNWEILDLKLPDDRLMRGPFHASYSAKLTAAMQQLRNYRHYFSRDDTREELVARFGYQPTHPRIAILMGRRSATEQTLADAQGVSGDLDIDIITYDDVVEFEENRLVLDATVAGLFTK